MPSARIHKASYVRGGRSLQRAGGLLRHNAVDDDMPEPALRLFDHWREVSEPDRGACAAIGNFDGVHLGHHSVIDLARAEARRRGAALGVVTFEPHPRSFFAPAADPFRLAGPVARVRALSALGVERLFQLTFDAALCALSPEQFARDIVVGRLGLSHVVVGSNFRFGKGRTGDADTLCALGAEYGFGVTIAPSFTVSQHHVSSSAIRAALGGGCFDTVRRMLGRPYELLARARLLRPGTYVLDLEAGGLPQAQMMIPRSGDYAVDIHALRLSPGQVSRGVLSVDRAAEGAHIELRLGGCRGMLDGQLLCATFLDHAGGSPLDAIHD